MVFFFQPAVMIRCSSVIEDDGDGRGSVCVNGEGWIHLLCAVWFSQACSSAPLQINLLKTGCCFCTKSWKC